MSTVHYLIVDNRGEVRVRKTSQMAWNEVAYKLTINVPRSWGRVLGEFTVNMPEAPLPELDLPEGWEWAEAAS